MKVSKHLLLSGALAASLATSAVLPTLSVFAGEAGQSNQASQSKTYQAGPDKGQEGPRQQAGDHCQGHDRGPGGHHQGHEGHEQGPGGHGQGKEKKEGQSTQNVQINVTMKQALEKAASQVPNGQVLGASLYDQDDQPAYSVVVKADKDFRFVFVDAQSGKVTEEEPNQEQGHGHDRQGQGEDHDHGSGKNQGPGQGQDKGPDKGSGQDQAPAQGQAPNQNQGPDQGQQPAPGQDGAQAQGHDAKPEFKAPSVSAQAALDAVLAKYADAKVYGIELEPSHEQDKAAAYTVTLESNQTFKQVTVDGETAAVTEDEDQEKGHHGPADHQAGQGQGPGQEGDRGQHQGPNQNQAGPGQGHDKQEGGPQGQEAPAESNKR
ncbi:PepSY domain-containing protein [Abiotrophia defectiva]|uniref:Peptidase propeptide and YPEB domain protein n=1 Tax=Abiotrophia defectiva ATCC 49176 TaxID=592010 RepID=W1Q6G6_ABIDE|nr:PepSY domain-containing protein [Abiotrophia defectiva]ESK66254.1 peptidase propeptide and YPEB domain protein [Abiotrophia defectiva ATCC 49176]QKH47175.1 PepSY domain-containing protein [Abiotrophia defectiva]